MLLTARQLRVRAGERVLLDGVDLTLGAEECAVVVGRNGAGKTTLLRALLGLVPAEGEVALGSIPRGSLGPRERAAAVGWLPQSLNLAEPVRAVELVAAGRFRFGEGRRARHEAAVRSMAEVGVEGFAERLVHTLSGGERQRVALSALVAQEAGLWLLDEPASHLDPGVQERVYRFLVDQWRGGRGLLLVTHDPDLMLRVVSREEAAKVRVLGLSEGRLALEARLSDEDLPEKLGELLDVRMCWAELGERRALAVLGAR
ncbi:MAG: ABC transporter ATP-binding protein [Deltaproteobacteria bacterium]|nr:MAG: ABC transporter ATP-binding protein [Deltaproteobacteria bacterium]